MRYILSTCLMLVLVLAQGQDFLDDIRLIKQRKAVNIAAKKEANTFKGPLKFYNQVITDQILNDCVYEHSCSEFSQGSFNTFGFFKGLMMTCDRLTRCNRTSLAETSPLLLTKSGKIKEHWDEYKRPE